jgi:hypothetical protein
MTARCCSPGWSCCCAASLVPIYWQPWRCGRSIPSSWQLLLPTGRAAVWLVPLLAPALGAIWLVGLSLALGDLSASILAVPPGVTTVAIRVFSLVHYGVEDQLAGLCLWTALLFGVLTVAAVKLLCYDRRSGGSVV